MTDRDLVLKHLSVGSLILALSVLPALTATDEGQPFGRMGEKDFESFIAYAGSHGLDVNAEMKLAYDGDAKALARVFELSTTFKSLNFEARAYGNLLFSTLLNLGETRGNQIFIDALALINDSCRQRVRDFFYYPVKLVPKRKRAEIERETREHQPWLFPPEYEFGKNDVLFK